MINNLKLCKSDKRVKKYDAKIKYNNLKKNIVQYFYQNLIHIDIIIYIINNFVILKNQINQKII